MCKTAPWSLAVAWSRSCSMSARVRSRVSMGLRILRGSYPLVLDSFGPGLRLIHQPQPARQPVGDDGGGHEPEANRQREHAEDKERLRDVFRDASGGEVSRHLAADVNQTDPCGRRHDASLDRP